jgi:hypothetical protein
MDWSGLFLLTLLGHETESRVTSVSGNVLDQFYCKRNWRFSVETCFASDKNCNLTLGYFVFHSSIFISVYHFHAQSLIQST